MKKWIAAFVCAGALATAKDKKPQVAPIDEYIQQALSRQYEAAAGSPGSLWSPGASMADLALDLRARRVDDLVTVVVFDRASALAKGSTTSSRSAAASASVAALGGTFSPTGRLANLANIGGDSQLDGQGQTSRETVLQTNLTARVTHVLPNGYLVVQGTKNVTVNSEVQLVTVRGIVRPVDLNPGNAVTSDQLGQLEVTVNGKGVVGDAIRRPHFLYRILLGALPF